MNLLQRLVKRVFFKSDQRYLLEMYNHGYIFESGFMKSYQCKEVVFNDGSPAPWFNYSFIDFLAPRLKDSMYIFEYGLGNSSKYFNEITPHCYGVDHDVLWYNKVVEGGLKKSNYYLIEDENYINAIKETKNIRKNSYSVLEGFMNLDKEQIEINIKLIKKTVEIVIEMDKNTTALS